MYELIEHRRLDSAAASITFSSIPQNYSDLVLVVSGRSTADENSGGSYANVRPNNSVSSQSARTLRGTGSSVSSNSESTVFFTIAHSGTTANTFGNSTVYIPNYTGSQSKSFGIDGVNENNATAARIELKAGLFSSASPITSLVLTPGAGNFVAGSSATLYGVNRTSGIGRAPLAMGGYMSYSNGYWVHTFPASGSFIPFTNMDVEYLVIAGGGGGGANGAGGGGGGAGGYRSSVVGELSGGGSLAESKLSLTANTNYAVTVGAGGAAITASGYNTTRNNGSDSVFSTITATGGGGGSGGNINGANGGSGGGGNGGYGVGVAENRVGGNGTANQGFGGGYGAYIGGKYSAGGGGGAGATGGNFNGTVAGAGGNGVPSSITGSSIIRAGGGGGGSYEDRTPGTGGFGGGGAGSGVATATSGTANTGGGGGGSGGLGTSTTSGAGGSGIVIVRYKA